MASSGSKRGVLFVCLGNICRSPIAEAVFIHRTKERGVADKWFTDSAACRDYHTGSSPDDRAMECLSSHGIKDYRHKARRIKPDDFSRFDFIFGMDNDNIQMIRQQAPKDPSKVTAQIAKLSDYDPQGLKEVPDPYYGGYDGFEFVYSQCVRCIDNFLDKHS